MPFETAFHSATRRLASGVRKVCLDHTRSPFSVSPPSIADRKSLFKRRHWMGAALCTLSTAMGRIGLLDYERELLLPQQPRRDCVQSWGKPRKSKGPFPSSVSWRVSGVLNAMSAVFV